jgi:hypothetical protein
MGNAAVPRSGTQLETRLEDNWTIENENRSDRP